MSIIVVGDLIADNTVGEMHVDDHADDKEEESDEEGKYVGLERQVRVVDSVGEAIGVE